MHAPYILSADNLDDSLDFYRKPSILAADDFLGACYRKAMTPQKLWTLLFLQFGVFGAQDSVLRDRCSVRTRHAFCSIVFLSI